MTGYGKKAAAKKIGVTITEVKRMMQTGELKRCTLYVKGDAKEGVSAEFVEKQRKRVGQAYDKFHEIKNFERRYQQEAFSEEQITIEYDNQEVRKGSIRLDVFPFFDTAGTAKVRKIWKLVFLAEHPADIAAEISGCLDRMSACIEEDLQNIDAAKKRLVNEVYAFWGPKTYVGERCEKIYTKLEREEKRLKKRKELFQDWNRLFKWD